MSAYKVTVALLTYNRSTFLPDVVQAILNQTYTDFEFLVIDNGSLDETPAVMTRLQNQRIKYVRLPPGSNAADSFLNALRMASGSFVLVTHDDDIMTSTMLEKQIAAVESAADIACVATNVQLIDESGSVVQPALYDMLGDRVFRKNSYLSAYLQEKIWLPTPTLLFNQQLLQKAHKRAIAESESVSVYRPSADIWLSVMLNTYGKLILLEEPLLKYRQHSAQESRNVDQSLPMVSFARDCLKTPRIRKGNRKLTPNILGLYLKYKVQHLLFSKKDLGELRRSISRISHLYNKARLQNKYLSECLTFEIMCVQLEIPLRKPRLGKNKSRDASSINMAYRLWLAKITAGSTFIPQRLKGKNIGVFGSMLTAYLLVNEAKKINSRIVGCFDSSPARIGSDIFGEIVKPLDSLTTFGPEIDLLVLSNEREHTEAIATMVCDKYRIDRKKIVHWIEFSHESSVNDLADIADY